MDKYHILHYTFGLPPKATGGLPIYVRDLSDAQKDAGYKVSILLPKQKLHGKDKISKKGNIYYLENSLPVSSIFGMKQPVDFMRKYNTSAVEKFLDRLSPNVIHIHSLMGLPKEFLEVAHSKQIKIIFTTHDYYGLCLKCNFVDFRGNICTDINCERCAKCNLINGISTKMSYMISSTLYKLLKQNTVLKNFKTKYRDKMVEDGLNVNEVDLNLEYEQIKNYSDLMEYYKSMFHLIDFFHFNSELTKEMYLSYLPNIKGEVIPITLSSIKDHRNQINQSQSEVVRIGYIGRKEPYKGINVLINVLEKLDKEDANFLCLLYGDDFSSYDSLLNGKIKNMGVYQNKYIEKVFNSIDVLVIPSICKETYGFIGLEALSYGIPVLFSENIGSKDLIKGCSSDYVFKNDELYNILSKTIENSEFLYNYRKIINEKLILRTMKEHAVDILNIYRN